MADIRLVILDFDGTLIGRSDEYSLYAVFKHKLDELRSRHGMRWAVSTGRSSRSFWRRFTPMTMAGIEPDFVVSRHAYISRRTPHGFRPHILWNLRIYYLLWQTRSRIRYALEDWHKLVLSRIRGAHTLVKGSDRLSIRFDTQDACDVAMELLNDRTKSNSHLMSFRYLSEIDIRSVPFTKGLALSELARRLGIGPEHILAVGNGHNDISMLDSRVARMTGCPMNSEAEVMEAVHKAGGHIAGRQSLGGVLDVLDAYMSGQVCSDLPAWWRPPSGGGNPHPIKKGRQPWTRNQKTRLALLICVVYVVTVVFASYGLIPLSNWIMMPFNFTFGLLERLLALLFR